MKFANPEPPDELLRQFDKNENEIEPRTRRWMWDHPEYEPFHAVGEIWLINRLGQICCSKRSENLKGNPGKWQTKFGGKVPVGSTPRETAIRELEEEAGIVPDPDFMFLVEKTKRVERYIYPFDGDTEELSFNDGEIVAVRWLTITEYHEEVKAFPDRWCNLIKPNQEMTILEWISEHRDIRAAPLSGRG